MKFKVITLFPDFFPGVLGAGIIGKTLNAHWQLETIDLKHFSRFVDRKPCGGGPGMVLEPRTMQQAIDFAGPCKKYILSPRGQVFNQPKALEMLETLTQQDILFIAGRYEGVDQRIIDYYNLEEISIGDFILCGGEVASMVIMEAIIRLIPGVVHNAESIVEESFYNGLLEHDYYTLPVHLEINNVVMSVPKVILSGDHKQIQQHNLLNSMNKTMLKRPDLWHKWSYNWVIIMSLVVITKIIKRFKKCL